MTILEMGASHPALGFDNEPLAGKNHKNFDVGTVEVYQLASKLNYLPERDQ